MKKLAFILIVLITVKAVRAMSLQISVNADPDPPDSEIYLEPGQTLMLDIWSPDGYMPGDDVYFSLVVDSYYGIMTGSPLLPKDPNFVVMYRDDAQINSMCVPPQDGMWGYIGSPAGCCNQPPGVYVPDILYDANDIGCGVTGDANLSLYTTVDFNSFVLEDSVVIHQRGLDCMNETHPDYAAWQGVGKPDCWCYPRQCRGNTNGCWEGPFPVKLDDVIFFRECFNKTDEEMPPGCICADFDHQKEGPFRVSLGDLYILRANVSLLVIPCCDQDADCDATNDPYFNCWAVPDCE